jgi:hypothetical protein
MRSSDGGHVAPCQGAMRRRIRSVLGCAMAAPSWPARAAEPMPRQAARLARALLAAVRWRCLLSSRTMLKARLRPMRGLKQDRSARVVIAGYAFIQHLRRGHYELAVTSNRPTAGPPRSTSWLCYLLPGPRSGISMLAHGRHRPSASWFVLAAEHNPPAGPGRAAGRRRTPYSSPPSTPSPPTSRHPQRRRTASSAWLLLLTQQSTGPPLTVEVNRLYVADPEGPPGSGDPERQFIVRRSPCHPPVGCPASLLWPPW